MKEFVNEIRDWAESFSPQEVMKKLTTAFPEQVVFSTSFGLEDQVITDMIAGLQLPVKIFTLDTGRLFSETYSVWNSTLERYQINIRAYYPDGEALNAFVSQHGPNAFYESVALRKQCCHIRKVEPLKKALQGAKIWITGLRSEQGSERQQLQKAEWDEANQIIKFHPLFDWTWEEVWNYVRTNHVPYNVLHDRGFPSIGCAPCTRAIKPGEDFRAGRWWWENNASKECGLHKR
ncbi:MAG: phosphoadenylyl-sulfate reductase [Chitinophagaceae bacterium]|nr:phosphoadenylyl-sulfate reductase [Chitinophagaceae bacterium]